MISALNKGFVRLSAAIGIAALAAASGAAKVVRIEAEAPVPLPAKPGTPAYEKVSGIFHGELDPRDPANRIITDIKKAARNARGLVEYNANFTITRAVDPAKRSGVLYYEVVNRGGGVGFEADEDGHSHVASGWQGDLARKDGVYRIDVPTAPGIEGIVLVRLIKDNPGAKSLSSNSRLTSMARRAAPVSLDTSKAKLVMEHQGQPDVEMAPEDWAFADCSKAPFPGTPDPTQICLSRPIDPNAAYRLTYTARDPLVLGIGWAATRDLVSFLRHNERDEAGNPNPMGSLPRWTIGYGNSQSGNFLRSFTHLGFNADEDGKRVFDGLHPNIAARQIVLNIRFGAPAGAASLYEPGSEGALWWGRYNDKARKRGISSLLDRCTRSGTCPKIFETFGSAEIWGLRASPGLVGTDAKADIPLPANVRRYYFPSVTHGGSFRGGFSLTGEAQFGGGICQLPGNPNSVREQMRALRKALVGWVTEDREPPASRYPTLAAGELVAPEGVAMGWPAIPGAPVPDGHINPLYDYDFGGSFHYRDVSGAVTRQPPAIRQTLPQRVPRVNADGNEMAGISSVQLLVPLGTYTGWNVEASGPDAGKNCGFAGGFIPFAKTKAEREAKGDPRLSLEERYRDHAGFVTAVKSTAAGLQAGGWLLPDDAARLVREAEESAVLKTPTP